MRSVLLCVALCLLAATAATAQSGREAPDMRPLSVTATVLVEEYDRGRVVKSRSFEYQLYFRDDGSAATLSPVVSAFKLKNARVRYLDRVVTADPREDFTGLEPGDEPGLVPLLGVAVADPLTGLPDHKIGGATLRDKNGRPVVLSLRVLYRNWRKRKVEVKVVEEEEPGDVPGQ